MQGDALVGLVERYRLVPMVNSNDRSRYWRCIDNGRSEWTCVRYNDNLSHGAWLRQRFDVVEYCGTDTLPHWRLYEVKPA